MSAFRNVIKFAYKYHCACGWFKSTSESDAGLTNVFGSGLSFDLASADRVHWRNVVWIVVPADALELRTEQGRHKVEYNVTSVSFFGGYFSIRIQFRRADHIIQNWRRNLVEIPWLFALISPWTKWPPFWQTTNSNAFFSNGNDIIPIWILLKFVPRSPIDIKPALVRAMAWGPSQ